MDPLYVLIRSELRTNLPLVHFQVVNRLVTGRSLAIPWLAAELVGPAAPCLLCTAGGPLSMFYPSVSLNCVYTLLDVWFCPFFSFTVPKIAFLQAFGVILVETFPSQGGPKDSSGSQGRVCD